MTAPDPWSVAGWTAAEHAAAAEQLAWPWRDWIATPLSPSRRCVLEAVRAELQRLGPVNLGPTRTVEAARDRLVPAAVRQQPEPSRAGDHSRWGLVVLSDDQPVRRLDESAAPFWLQLPAERLDRAASLAQTIPVLDGHGGPRVGTIVELWTQPPMTLAAIEWSRTAAAFELRERLEAGRLSLSFGAVLVNEAETLPRLVRPSRWLIGEVSLLPAGEQAFQVAGAEAARGWCHGLAPDRR